MDSKLDGGKVSFEAALDKTGFGLYSYLMTSLTGFVVIAFGCISYGTSFIIPVSACELETNGAQQGALAAVPLIGLILGGVLWGGLADIYGRRNTLIISLLSAAAVNAIASISVHWAMLMVFQFLAAFLSSGQFSLSMTLLSESVPMAKRNFVVVLVTTIFMVAQGLMAVLALPIIPLSFSYYLPALDIYWNSWRTLVLVYCSPSLIAAAWLFFMQESPKFAFSKGREEEALRILNVIHRVNNLRSKEGLEILGIREEASEQTGSISVKEQIMPLFRAPLVKYTIIMTSLFVCQQVGSFMVWLPTIANQFMNILQTGEGSDSTLCQILTASLESPPEPDPNEVPCSLNVTAMLFVLGVGIIQSTANILVSFTVTSVGRRNMVIIVVTICGASGIIVNLVPNAIGSAVMFGIFLIGFLVMGLYTAITVALFPTSLRALAVALTMTGGRVAGVAALQVVNFMLANHCEIGFYVFAAIYLSSAVIVSFLPDDRKPPPPAPPQPKDEVERL